MILSRRRVVPRSHVAVWAGTAVLISIVLVVLAGPWLAPHGPDQPIAASFTPPGSGHPLGTDFLGRDVLSRLLWGGRSVLLFAGAATILAYAVGLGVGLLAGYSRSWIDPALMRSVDILLAFPALVFILLLAAALGTGIWSVLLATAVIQVPGIARIIRTATLEQSVRGFVEAALLRGESTSSILRREIMPNIAGPIAADVGLRFTWSVILIASVNFLGLGLQPPAADWGVMVSENRGGLNLNPYAMLAPALILGALTVAINLISDSLARRYR
jgi:peptide/nickel transport system permease protein